MIVFNRRLYIALLPFLVVVALLLIMAKLGFWQLDRAAQKKALLTAVSDAQTQQVQRLYKVPAELLDWQYRKIDISGRYLKDKQLLLDNRFSGKADDKRAGYEVLTPFELQDGSVVLVNRGWLPRAANRSDLPNIAMEQNIKQLKGIVRKPAKAFSLGNINELSSTWPKLIQFIDIAQLSELLDMPLHQAIVMLLPEQPEGYSRHWQNQSDIKMGPAVHYGYAFQWFALSLTLLVLSVFIVIKKSEKVKA